MNKLFISNILIFGIFLLFVIASWGMFIWSVFEIPIASAAFCLCSCMCTYHYYSFVKKSLAMQDLQKTNSCLIKLQLGGIQNKNGII